MGYQLDGALIEHLDGCDVISDGIMMGSIQVPGSGKPIIMMADRQTTGGYTKIATVISPDFYKLAQAKPGDRVGCEEVSVEVAQEIYISQKIHIRRIKDQMLGQKLGVKQRV